MLTSAAQPFGEPDEWMLARAQLHFLKIMRRFMDLLPSPYADSMSQKRKVVATWLVKRSHGIFAQTSPISGLPRT